VEQAELDGQDDALQALALVFGASEQAGIPPVGVQPLQHVALDQRPRNLGADALPYMAARARRNVLLMYRRRAIGDGRASIGIRQQCENLVVQLDEPRAFETRFGEDPLVRLLVRRLVSEAADHAVPQARVLEAESRLGARGIGGPEGLQRADQLQGIGALLVDAAARQKGFERIEL